MSHGSGPLRQSQATGAPTMRLALHVDLICRTHGPGMDGIRDHGLMLARAVADNHGATATVHDLRCQSDPRDLLRLTSRQFGVRHAVLLQYNPFSYGHWGCAPWLVPALRRVRHARPDSVVVLLAHELFVQIDGPRSAALGIAQRAQFSALAALSDVVLTTTERFASRAKAFARKRPHVLPVGSNLPDRRSARETTRKALGLRDDQVVVGLFGMGHWSRMFDLIDATIQRVARGRSLVVLNLGSGAPPLRVVNGDIIVRTPGELSDVHLAEYLSAVDVLLLPFADGVSIRRTTLMAGLQHAIPIVTTDGPSTGPLLRQCSAIAVMPQQGVSDAFAARVESLLKDDQVRVDMGVGGRALYDEHFDWPIIGRALINHVAVVFEERGP